MKHADEIGSSRISEALQQPGDTPDVTDFVMARLPINRKPAANRWVWACAAACMVLALGLYLLLRPSQPARIVNTVPEHRSPEVRHHTPAPRSPVQPQLAAAPEKHTQPRYQRQRPVRLAHLPKKHRSRPLPVPNHIEQPESPNAMDGVNAAMQSALAEAVAMQMKQTVRTLPPNPDADKIERPPLTVILNSGPERTPVAQPGG